MFGFDTKYAMFDITPLENQFILEYLPAAKGDYVKVYLYGLMRCYHPEEDMNLDRMCHELNMTEENVLNAFGYWERKRLVRRISDNPPKWQYINIKQINLAGGDMDPEPEYTEFSNALYDAFDKVRRLHGSELNTCFEWHEEMKLPTEVIIMLLNHMTSVKGKNFKIKDADKVAAQMATEDVRTVEAAEAFFSRDEQSYAGIRKILKMLGKNYLPSEAQVSLYRKWTLDWGFDPEAVEAAVDLTAKGDPSLGYLDGILNSLYREAGSGKRMTPERIRQSSQKSDGFREVLKELGKGEINQRSLQLYDQMLALYPQDIVLIAAKECGHNGKDAGDTLKLLQSWKEKGLDTRNEVEKYVQAFHDQTALIRELKKNWGTDDTRISKADRSLVLKWKSELGFSTESILAAAEYASEAKQPMAYLDRILTDCQTKGLTTPDQIRHEHSRNGASAGSTDKKKKVNAQDYEQRSYTEVQDQMMEAQNRRIMERLHADGGTSDA